MQRCGVHHSVRLADQRTHERVIREVTHLVGVRPLRRSTPRVSCPALRSWRAISSPRNPELPVMRKRMALLYLSPPEDPALQGWGCMALWLAVW